MNRDAKLIAKSLEQFPRVENMFSRFFQGMSFNAGLIEKHLIANRTSTLRQHLITELSVFLKVESIDHVDFEILYELDFASKKDLYDFFAEVCSSLQGKSAFPDLVDYLAD